MQLDVVHAQEALVVQCVFHHSMSSALETVIVMQMPITLRILQPIYVNFAILQTAASVHL